MSYTNSVLELIERQALLRPDKEAFGDPEGDITFKELCDGAKLVGSGLLPYIGSRSPIAFYMEKSCSAVIGMFGAVYAGGFYSFLDVRQPIARVQKIVDKLNPPVIFTTGELFDKAKELELPQGTGLFILDDFCREQKPDPEGLARARRNALDTDPLYVNFTSGSTGTPKGVTVSHRSVLEFIGYFADIFEITDEDILGNQAPFDFDVSVKDIYTGLMTGAKVQLIPRDYFSAPMNLMDYLADKEVSVLVWAVSAMCFVSIMNGLEYRLPDRIRMIMFSGEVMPVKHLKHWQKFLPDATYVNLYGPTEITCNCTYHILDREYEDTESIPAGIPFPNEKVFLLGDDDEEITASKETGEICVCGTSLALGYYKDPEKTAAAFMTSPLEKCYPEMMYRTGDLGYFDENGLLYYVSRKDFQIKHLGHRIELGEIEVNVMAQQGVDRACCLYDQEKKKIVMFYTGTAEKKALLQQLKTGLPPFMVPSAVRQLDAMPVNKNGKIDRQALYEMYKEKK